MRKKDIIYLGLIVLLTAGGAFAYAIASSVDVDVDSYAMEKRNIAEPKQYVQVVLDEDAREAVDKSMTSVQNNIIIATRKIREGGTLDAMNSAYDCIRPLIPTTTTTTETTVTTIEETTTTTIEAIAEAP